MLLDGSATHINSLLRDIEKEEEDLECIVHFVDTRREKLLVLEKRSQLHRRKRRILEQISFHDESRDQQFQSNDNNDNEEETDENEDRQEHGLDLGISISNWISTLISASSRRLFLQKDALFKHENEVQNDEPVATMNTSILEDESLLSQRAKQWGFSIHPIQGDGACMFRSVSHQLFGHENRHAYLRVEALKFIEENASDYLADKTDLQRILFLDEMRLNRTWGDERMLYAMAQRFQLILVLIHDFKDAPPIRIEPRSVENAQQVRTLYLGFYHERHYVSLVVADN